MANSVVDTLVDWQPDADGGDTNLPKNITVMSDGAPGDLDGELRRIKSEVRGESILKSWERWKGIKNLAATGNIAFTFVSAGVFTVNDDFSVTGRNVAVIGRRVRATLSGLTIYGGIRSVSFSAPDTTITVGWDSGTLNGSLSEVAFGPDPNNLSAVLASPFGLAEIRRAINKSAANASADLTVTETPIFDLVLSEGLLSTSGFLKLTMLCRVTVAAAVGSTLTVRLKYGATTIATATIAWTGGVSNSDFRIEAILVGDNSVSAQLGQLTILANGPDVAASDFAVKVKAGTATEDSTLAKNFTVTVQWDTNDDQFSVLYQLLEKT